jgi:hypothetical protein
VARETMDFESLSLISVCSIDRDIPFQPDFEFLSYLKALTDRNNFVRSKSPAHAISKRNCEGLGYAYQLSQRLSRGGFNQS